MSAPISKRWEWMGGIVYARDARAASRVFAEALRRAGCGTICYIASIRELPPLMEDPNFGIYSLDERKAPGA